MPVRHMEARRRDFPGRRNALYKAVGSWERAPCPGGQAVPCGSGRVCIGQILEALVSLASMGLGT